MHDFHILVSASDCSAAGSDLFGEPLRQNNLLAGLVPLEACEYRRAAAAAALGWGGGLIHWCMEASSAASSKVGARPEVSKCQ